MLKALKPHIGIFGLRNVGKSSVVNFLSKQNTAIVSGIAGTTTDPVRKHIELGKIGACVIIDTAGIDDHGELGEKRIKSTLATINSCNLAIIVCDQQGINEHHKTLIELFQKHHIPWFIVWNKIDLHFPTRSNIEDIDNCFLVPIILCSTILQKGTVEIIETIEKLLPEKSRKNSSIIGDLVNHGDLILLVTPIDQEAPKGRLITPQIQTIRDILDNDCMAVVLKERELDIFFKNYNIIPKLVITDSQAFLKVKGSIPTNINMTSFSILFARLKGNFEKMVEGTRYISKLENNDPILIMESCSHHTTGDDIGRVKIPRWLKNFTGKKLNITFLPGSDHLPTDLDYYKLVIQCGGCMLTAKEMQSRLQPFIDKNIAVTNYGMCIAYTLGVFEDSLKCFNTVTSTNEDYL